MSVQTNVSVVNAQFPLQSKVIAAILHQLSENLGLVPESDPELVRMSALFAKAQTAVEANVALGAMQLHATQLYVQYCQERLAELYGRGYSAWPAFVYAERAIQATSNEEFDPATRNQAALDAFDIMDRCSARVREDHEFVREVLAELGALLNEAAVQRIEMPGNELLLVTTLMDEARLYLNVDALKLAGTMARKLYFKGLHSAVKAKSDAFFIETDRRETYAPAFTRVQEALALDERSGDFDFVIARLDDANRTLDRIAEREKKARAEMLERLALENRFRVRQQNYDWNAYAENPGKGAPRGRQNHPKRGERNRAYAEQRAW